MRMGHQMKINDTMKFVYIPIFDVRCSGDVSIVYIAIVSSQRIATKFQSSYQFNQITSNQ